MTKVKKSRVSLIFFTSGYIYYMKSYHDKFNNKYFNKKKMNMNSTNICQTRKDRHGANNPMFGRKHSDEARRKQSEAAKKRNMEFQKWKAANRPLTMDEFLSSQPMREHINIIIKEEIKRLIWKGLDSST